MNCIFSLSVFLDTETSFFTFLGFYISQKIFKCSPIGLNINLSLNVGAIFLKEMLLKVILLLDFKWFNVFVHVKFKGTKLRFVYIVNYLYFEKIMRIFVEIWEFDTESECFLTEWYFSLKSEWFDERINCRNYLLLWDKHWCDRVSNDWCIKEWFFIDRYKFLGKRNEIDEGNVYKIRLILMSFEHECKNNLM